MSANADLVRDYLAALTAMTTGPELARFFHPQVEQVEFPNRLVPKGATRDLRALLEGAERGSNVTSAQSFVLTTLIEQGDRIAAEFDWWAELTIPIGTLAAGDRMTGHFCTIIEFRDGLIHRQRSYDCFDPF